jgi:hypothetical protein
MEPEEDSIGNAVWAMLLMLFIFLLTYWKH